MQDVIVKLPSLHSLAQQALAPGSLNWYSTNNSCSQQPGQEHQLQGCMQTSASAHPQLVGQQQRPEHTNMLSGQVQTSRHTREPPLPSSPTPQQQQQQQEQPQQHCRPSSDSICDLVAATATLQLTNRAASMPSAQRPDAEQGLQQLGQVGMPSVPQPLQMTQQILQQQECHVPLPLPQPQVLPPQQHQQGTREPSSIEGHHPAHRCASSGGTPDLFALALLLTAAKALFCGGALSAAQELLQLCKSAEIEGAAAAAATAAAANSLLQPGSLQQSGIRNEAAYAALIRRLLAEVPPPRQGALNGQQLLSVIGDSHILPRKRAGMCHLSDCMQWLEGPASALSLRVAMAALVHANHHA